MPDPIHWLDSLDTAEDFMYDIFIVILLFITIPILLRLILNIIIDLVNSIFNWGVRRNSFNFAMVVRFIAFPGTLLRGTFIFLLLHLKGWKVNINFGVGVGQAMGNYGFRDNYYRGFGFNMSPGHKIEVTLKDTIHIAMSSYMVELIAIIIFMFRHWIISFILYVYGPRIDLFLNFPTIWLFWYLFMGIVIGGIPVTQEILLPLYYIFIYNPQLVVFAIFNLFTASLIAEIFGNSIGLTCFILFFSLGHYSNELKKKEYKEINDSEIFLNTDDLDLIFKEELKKK